MPWLKVSDQAAQHPIVLRSLDLDDADDRILNELFGFVARCAVSAAAFETDYVLEPGMIKQIAGMSRWKALTDAAVAAGYFVPMRDEDDRLVYKLVEEKDLFHMILREERAWEQQRRNDNRNTRITVPVRKRDGDACRWCGKITRWDSDRKSGRFGTYDHLRPGQAATVDTLVVACNACNSARRDDAASWTGALRPAPDSPYYGEDTVQFLAKHGVTVKPSDTLPMDVPGARARASLIPVEPSKPVEPNPTPAGRTVPGQEQSTGSITERSSEPGTPTAELHVERPSEPNPAPAGRTVPVPPRVEPHGQGRGPDDPADIYSSRQITTLPDPDMPGRDGSGRVGPGRNGSTPPPRGGRDYPSTPQPPAPRHRRGRRRKRKNP